MKKKIQKKALNDDKEKSSAVQYVNWNELEMLSGISLLGTS